MTPCPENAPSEAVFIVMRSSETPVRQIKTKKGKMKMETNNTIDLDKAIDMPANGIDVIPTGIPSLDEMLGGGLPRGSLTVIASRPGMGKTSLALQLAGNIAAVGESVCFCSLEISKDGLIRILEKQSGSIHGYKTLHIDDHTNADVPYITGKIHSLAKCDAVFVDYLQLMMRGPGWPVWDGGFGAMRALKALAGSENISVIVTSQLPRPDVLPSFFPDKESYHRPILSDVGNPEQFTDVVIFPFRESYYSEEPELKDKNELIVAKNRYGATGSIPVHWKPEKMIFEEKVE